MDSDACNLGLGVLRPEEGRLDRGERSLQRICTGTGAEAQAGWHREHRLVDVRLLVGEFQVGLHPRQRLGLHGLERGRNRIEMPTMDVIQVRDGKIVATWHLQDFAGLMGQLKAPSDVPTPAAWG
ncbi:hypothetical protein ACRQ4B_06435 [Curtobacterium sp. SP.BCo]|uniref:hypothetical protein n=1 Tax=Curtobacterium sp. SP.BCo TaxID=3435229 RepID=UPI003F7414B1